MFPPLPTSLHLHSAVALSTTVTKTDLMPAQQGTGPALWWDLFARTLTVPAASPMTLTYLAHVPCPTWTSVCPPSLPLASFLIGVGDHRSRVARPSFLSVGPIVSRGFLFRLDPLVLIGSMRNNRECPAS